jgi:hypothetical protein
MAMETDLFITDVLGRERDRTFHRQDGQDLEQVCAFSTA